MSCLRYNECNLVALLVVILFQLFICKYQVDVSRWPMEKLSFVLSLTLFT